MSKMMNKFDFVLHQKWTVWHYGCYASFIWHMFQTRNQLCCLKQLVVGELAAGPRFPPHGASPPMQSGLGFERNSNIWMCDLHNLVVIIPTTCCYLQHLVAVASILLCCLHHVVLVNHTMSCYLHHIVVVPTCVVVSSVWRWPCPQRVAVYSNWWW